ncbi:MAG: hypothetical protein IKO07_00665 [Clostridia bacterium]|nr:hypothetical protein [Clostridia bacterium]
MKRFWLLLLILFVLCALPAGAWAESADGSSSAGMLNSRGAGGGILSDTRFPDTAFRETLDKLYGDENHNVNFNITKIDVSDCGIQDLTGIALFTNLEELDVSDNELSILSLSDLNRLSVLDCSRNQLTFLNVGSCPTLTAVSCSDQPLETLGLIGPNNTLKRLDCSGTNLSSLDLENFTALELLDCSGCSSLGGLNLSGCGELVTLTCNHTAISALNISGTTKLNYLDCNNCRLAALSVDGHPAIESIFCQNIATLTSLTVSGCQSLTELDCSWTDTTCASSLTSLTATGCPVLYSILCENNGITDLTISNCPELYTLNCSGNRIESLPMNQLTELVDLDCADNRLTSLNVTGCASLWSLECKGNQIASLDLRSCPELYFLECHNNKLTSLLIQNCAELNVIHAHGNLLTSLDISGTALFDAYNPITPNLDTVTIDGKAAKAWIPSGGSSFEDWPLTVDSSVLLINHGLPFVPDLIILPNDLTTIGEDAFNRIMASSVYIPRNVTTIVGDPFDGSPVRTVYGFSGTEAERFVQAHSAYFTFIPLDGM